MQLAFTRTGNIDHNGDQSVLHSRLTDCLGGVPITDLNVFDEEDDKLSLTTKMILN